MENDQRNTSRVASTRAANRFAYTTQ